jgi:serine/threonine protein kinase
MSFPGDYTKVAQIGKGTYSTVFLAKKKDYVIKSIQSTDDYHVCSSVLWDIVIPTTLRHRNIATVKKVIFGDTSVDIVIPRYTHIVSMDTTIMFKLLHALKYLHDNRVIHRDLKRCNIMMDKDEPIIIDFSISRIGLLDNMSPILYSDGHRHKSVATGTYGYSADIYAMGITFLSIILGLESRQMALSNIKDLCKDKRLNTEMGNIVLSMIDEDNIPSLEYLLSLPVFSNIKEPICSFPVYRERRYMTSLEKCRVDTFLCLYGTSDVRNKTMCSHIVQQIPKDVSVDMGNIVDIASSILDDECQYDLNVKTLSLVCENMYIGVL